jgi:hypothetical protein
MSKNEMQGPFHGGREQLNLRIAVDATVPDDVKQRNNSHNNDSHASTDNNNNNAQHTRPEYQRRCGMSIPQRCQGR